MNRVGYIVTCFLAGSLLFSSCTEKEQPNFVIFLVDDLGWADVGCNNPATFYETPNVDRLAQEGILFTDAYASCPVCSPTRASIMTGKYPVRLHITDWIPGNDPQNRKLLGPKDQHELPHTEITLAETLKENGYVTCHIGKWHLGGAGSYPEDHGFDVNIGGWEKGSPGQAGYYSPYENPKLPDGPEGEYLTERLTREAIRFINNQKEKPFFLYFSFYTVHTPIQACSEHIDHFIRKRSLLDSVQGPPQRIEHDGFTKLFQDNAEYASMVAAMDESVGNIMELLDDLGLKDQTYVLFTSDNGGLSTLYREGYPTSNLPLRAGKGWCYEGGIRVPLILSGPGMEPQVTSLPATSTDFYPTILALAGISSIPDQHLDGINLLPLIEDQSYARTLFWHYPHYHGSAWTPGAAVRSGNWKLIEFYENDKVELYDLGSDLEESQDLSGSNQQKRDALLELLHTWQKEVGADMPVLNPDF